jgi:hypothetical protein
VAKPPSPEPVFSLAELARSWAEVTGDTPENILYRLGDWTMTDAFPVDAFLTGAAGTVIVQVFGHLSAERAYYTLVIGGVPFEKEGIFQRIWWHRKLSEKISEEGDPKKRERLQKYADNHMQIAEEAVLRRDVIVQACHAMNVNPPPILGLKEAAPHAVPPELAPDTPVRVGRDHEKPACRRDIMAPDEAKQYSLLWDVATMGLRSNGHSLEWNWLRLMDRFWTGELSPTGLVYFFPGRPGREFVVFEREALARLLLGHRDRDGTIHIERLRQWTLADYLTQPLPYCDYFERDPHGRVGLAIRTDRLNHSKYGVGSSIEMTGATSLASRAEVPKRKRLAYYGLLERFIAEIKPEVLKRLSDHAIAKQFEDHCRNLLNAGKPAPSLPGDRRNVQCQVGKIRARTAVSVPKV